MFTLTIKTGNAAFAGENGESDDYARNREIARILRQAAKWLEDGAEKNTLRDSNGNTVGKFEIE